VIGWGSQAPAQAQNLADTFKEIGLDIPVAPCTPAALPPLPSLPPRSVEETCPPRCTPAQDWSQEPTAASPLTTRRCSTLINHGFHRCRSGSGTAPPRGGPPRRLASMRPRAPSVSRTRCPPPSLHTAPSTARFVPPDTLLSLPCFCGSTNRTCSGEGYGLRVCRALGGRRRAGARSEGAGRRWSGGGPSDAFVEGRL
jgi:hypothetical protein